MIMKEATNLKQAFAYATDCNLATVCDMAMTRSRKKGEYWRQIKIAQKMCDWMSLFDVDPESTRAADIIGKRSVEQWAFQFEPPLRAKNNPPKE